MERSLVGDPIIWPGLVYSPLNRSGLIYALGTISHSLGLLFEEFSEEGETAFCRRKTESGWERIKVGFTLRSSEFAHGGDDAVDLIVCWQDDRPDADGPPRLELSHMAYSRGEGKADVTRSRSALEALLPENAATDLLERGRHRESYEEAVRELDGQIKKLRES